MKKTIALLCIIMLMYAWPSSAGTATTPRPNYVCITISCCEVGVIGVGVFTATICYESVPRYGMPVTHHAEITNGEGSTWNGDGTVTIKNDVVYQEENGHRYRIVHGSYEATNYKADIMVEEYE